MHEQFEEDDLRFELTIHEEGEELPAVDTSVMGYFAAFIKIYKKAELPEEIREHPGVVSKLEILSDNMTVDEVAGILLFIQANYPEAVDLANQMIEIGTDDGENPIVSFRDVEGEDDDE